MLLTSRQLLPVLAAAPLRASAAAAGSQIAPSAAHRRGFAADEPSKGVLGTVADAVRGTLNEASAAAKGAAGAAGAEGPSADEAGAKFQDEYPDSGEWVDKPPRGTLFTEDEARAAGEGEEGGRLLAARSQQSDHSFDDEYPDSGEWVDTPGGTGHPKWVRWRQSQEETLAGGL